MPIRYTLKNPREIHLSISYFHAIILCIQILNSHMKATCNCTAPLRIKNVGNLEFRKNNDFTDLFNYELTLYYENTLSK